jgi:hypothetical protein
MRLTMGGWKDWSVCNAVRRIPIQDPNQPLNAEMLHDDRSLRQHDIRGLAPKIRHGCMRAARAERREYFCYGHNRKQGKAAQEARHRAQA